MSLMWCMFSMSPQSSMSCRSSSSSISCRSRKTRFSRILQQIRVSRDAGGDVMHPHLKRTFRLVLSSGRRFGPRHAPPPQACFCHWRPNSVLSSKCSLFTSCRGRFAPDLATKSRLRPLRHQTPFPVHPHYCTKGASDKRPCKVPPRVGSFSALRSFTLSCNSLESLDQEAPKR